VIQGDRLKEGCAAKETKDPNLTNIMNTLQNAKINAKRPFSSMARKNVTL
jgi:hypothetical protein